MGRRAGYAPGDPWPNGGAWIFCSRRLYASYVARMVRKAGEQEAEIDVVVEGGPAFVSRARKREEGDP
jgi:hypothetical protein